MKNREKNREKRGIKRGKGRSVLFAELLYGGGVMKECKQEKRCARVCNPSSNVSNTVHNSTAILLCSSCVGCEMLTVYCLLFPPMLDMSRTRLNDDRLGVD